MKRYFVFRIRKHFGRTRRKEQNRSLSFTISVFVIRTFGNKSCVEIHPKKCVANFLKLIEQDELHVNSLESDFLLNFPLLILHLFYFSKKTLAWKQSCSAVN